MNIKNVVLSSITIIVTITAFLAFRPAKITFGTLFTDSSGRLLKVPCMRSYDGFGFCKYATYYTQHGVRLGKFVASAAIE